MTKEMKTVRSQNTKEYWRIQMKVNVDKTKIVVFFLKDDYQEILFLIIMGLILR